MSVWLLILYVCLFIVFVNLNDPDLSLILHDHLY